MTDREYLKEINAAAEAYARSLEGNSFYGFHAGAAYVRKNPPPQFTAIIEVLRRILQSKGIDQRLEYEAEVKLERFEASRQKWS